MHEALADYDDGSGGTAVLEGLESGGYALLSFRPSQTPCDGLPEVALVQSIDY